MMLLFHMVMAALLVDVFYLLLPYILKTLGYALALFGWLVVFTVLSLYAQSLPRPAVVLCLALFGAGLAILRLLAWLKRRGARETVPLNPAPKTPGENRSS